MPNTSVFRIQQTIEWIVCLNTGSEYIDSPPFYFNGVTWCFKMLLNICYNNELDFCWWVILSPTGPTQGWVPFVITTKVRARDGRAEPTFNRRLERNNQDPNYLLFVLPRDIGSQRPDLVNDRNEVTIVFTFNGVNLRERPETVSKSVQTPMYLDERASLKGLSLDLIKLTLQDTPPDVELQCGGQSFSSHRSILGARSEVFRAMLGCNMIEGQLGSVQIVDMEYDHLRLLLRYVYTGTLPQLTVASASALYEAGDKYQIRLLRKHCADVLLQNLTLENSCDMLFMADAHSDNDFKARIICFMIVSEVPIKYDGWNKFNEDYPRLVYDVLYQAYKFSRPNCGIRR